MTNLREAAQMALNDLEALVAYIKGSEPDLVMQVPAIEALREALRAALAQPEQEPVAWVDNRIHGWPDCVVMEPDAPHTSPLYTAPLQREWVGLTDEEQMQVAWSCGAMSADWLDFARAIEAKLLEKNSL